MSDDRKHVQTALSVPEWKRFRLAAKAKGLSVKDAAREAVLAWTSRETPPPSGLHAYKPHRKYPWFCAVCGYAEHERLQHPPRTEPGKQGEEARPQ
jgi:hypothetical protein